MSATQSCRLARCSKVVRHLRYTGHQINVFVTAAGPAIKPDWLSNELGVPVVEGIGAPIRMAAMLAGLGLRHSRKRWPKSNARPSVI